MKGLRYFCFILGTALLAAALCLVLHNLYTDQKGDEQAEAVLSVLREEIPETVPETAAQPAEEMQPFTESGDTVVPDMQNVTVDGQMYIGYLSIPALNLELPVRADWSYPALKASPCRYAGNLYENNLIIAAHNYNAHFGRIGSLSVGAELCFTDVTGEKHLFSVCEIEQLAGTDIEHMQFGSAEDWDLTLFTCTLNGQSRVTVRAKKTQT